MYDAQYAAIRSTEEFEVELSKQKVRPVRIIEVFTDRQTNVKAHHELWSRITKRLDSNA